MGHFLRWLENYCDLNTRRTGTRYRMWCLNTGTCSMVNGARSVVNGERSVMTGIGSFVISARYQVTGKCMIVVETPFHSDLKAYFGELNTFCLVSNPFCYHRCTFFCYWNRSVMYRTCSMVTETCPLVTERQPMVTEERFVMMTCPMVNRFAMYRTCSMVIETCPMVIERQPMVTEERFVMMTCPMVTAKKVVQWLKRVCHVSTRSMVTETRSEVNGEALWCLKNTFWWDML